jgi:hypothetical protein
MLFMMTVFMLYVLLIIGGSLQVNPVHRMTVTDILDRLAAIAETKNINLKEPLVLEGKRIDSTSSPGWFIGLQCHSLSFFRLCFFNQKKIMESV